MTEVLIKFGIRFAVFALVLGVAFHRSSKVTLQPKWALPFVALVFAILNASLYWLIKPVLSFVAIGPAWLVVPFFVNGAFLYFTNKLFDKAHIKERRVQLKIDGFMTLAWLSLLLTAGHWVLEFGFSFFK